MTTLKYYLRDTNGQNQNLTLYLRITKDRKHRVISMKMNCSIEQWDSSKEKFKSNFQNYKEINEFLNSFRIKAQAIDNEYRIKGHDYSLKDIESKLFSNKSKNKQTLFDFWDSKIDSLKKANKIGNYRIYRDVKKSFIEFLGGRSIDFKDLTYTLVNAYDVYMRSNGNQDTTISLRMRTLRALFNDAVKNDLVSKELYPFSKFIISKLKTETSKRAMSIDEFEKIKNFDISEYPYFADTLYIFLFSYYTRGMNFIDISFLKWENVQGDKLYYIRSKNKKNFIMRIKPEVAKIIEYYKTNRITEYIFPIINKNDLTPIQIRYRQDKILKKFNKEIKQIGKLCDITTPITSYVVRHTFANSLRKKGMSIDMISELMGHDATETTHIYLKKIEDNELDDELDKFI